MFRPSDDACCLPFLVPGMLSLTTHLPYTAVRQPRACYALTPTPNPNPYPLTPNPNPNP